MADYNKNFCVKCDENIGEVPEDKVIKCNNISCKGCMHYNCSSYNVSELQFLESNKSNIKWFCDDCTKDEINTISTSQHCEESQENKLQNSLQTAKFACVYLIESLIKAIEKHVNYVLKTCDSSSEFSSCCSESRLCIC